MDLHSVRQPHRDAGVLEHLRLPVLQRGVTLWNSGEAGAERRRQISHRANVAKWMLQARRARDDHPEPRAHLVIHDLDKQEDMWTCARCGASSRKRVSLGYFCDLAGGRQQRLELAPPPPRPEAEPQDPPPPPPPQPHPQPRPPGPKARAKAKAKQGAAANRDIRQFFAKAPAPGPASEQVD